MLLALTGYRLSDVLAFVDSGKKIGYDGHIEICEQKTKKIRTVKLSIAELMLIQHPIKKQKINRYKNL